MIKSTLSTFLWVAILGNLCRVGLPWWSLAIIAAIGAWVFARNAWGAFFGGLLGGFVVWYGYAWLADSENAGKLSGMVGQLFMGAKPAQLMLVTGLMGGLMAAFGASTGCLARSVIFGRESQRRSYMQQRRRR
jgi:hypothetical protein